LHEGIWQTNKKLPQDTLLQFAATCQFDHLLRIQMEISNPVRTLTLVVDRVRKTTFFPKSADFDLTTSRFDQTIDLAWQFVAISGQTIGVEYE